MALKYTTEVTINVPRQRVVELIDNNENLKHWQPGFVSMERISGEPGAVGSKSRLKYKMGKRDIEMVETVLKSDFPNGWDASFEANAVMNIQHNRFEALSENTTKWISESEFQFKNFGMKLMGALMPGAFKKQSQLYLDEFKAFAEKQG